MYKVLIVDDEPLAREYIKKIVDWEGLDLEICGEAEDGKDALEKAYMLHPDIILLDIIMPNMDGLAFAAGIRENNIKTSIIIISGSDEFEYVRKSIKLEVKDYLLKPFDVDEIQDALMRISTELSKEDIHSKVNTRSIVYNILMNPVDENINAAKAFVQQGNIESFTIGVIYCHDEEKRGNIISNLRIHSKKYNHLIFIENGTHRIICFFANWQGESLELCKVLEEFIDNNLLFKRELFIGVGQSYEKIEDIRESYNEAVEIVNNGVVFNEIGIRLYCPNDSVYNKYFYSTADTESLLVSLRSFDKEKVVEKIVNIYKNIEDNKVEYKQMINISNGLISICASTIVEKSKSIQDKYDRSGYVINFRNRSLLEIRNSVIDFYTTSIELSRTTILTKAQQVSIECAQFIENNYSNPALSIAMVSEYVHLDESYVRRVFKKAHNKTMNNYIIDYRMQKAKDLIIQKRYKHSTIAEMVGYIDAAYFSKSFKKAVGQSPREFEVSN